MDQEVAGEQALRVLLRLCVLFALSYEHEALDEMDPYASKRAVGLTCTVQASER